MVLSAERPSEDLVARLFELSLDMLGTVSAAGYFTRLNPACERTLGWTIEALMAEPFTVFVHPDDLEVTLEHVRKTGETGRSAAVPFENRFRTRDGDYRWIEWTSVTDTGTRYFVGKDVTERRAADVDRVQNASVMQAIVESVTDGLCVVDSRGQLTFMNPAGVRLLGYESAEELLGGDAHATFHHSLCAGTPFAIDDCPLAKVRQRSPCPRRRGRLLAQGRLGVASLMLLSGHRSQRWSRKCDRLPRHHRHAGRARAPARPGRRRSLVRRGEPGHSR